MPQFPLDKTYILVYNKRIKEKRNMLMKLKGAQIIVKCIEEQGIDTIYGYPGGSVLDIFDALYEDRDK